MIKILLLLLFIIIIIIYVNKKNEYFVELNDNYNNYDYILKDIYPSSNVNYFDINNNDKILKDIYPSNINYFDNLAFNINHNEKLFDEETLLNNNYEIINLSNINTILKFPKKSINCYLVTKKYKLDDNNIPDFKYEVNNLKDDKCNYDLYNLNSNQQLLIDNDNNKIDINLIGSCRYSNKECIDFIDKKTCDKYDMLWSPKTCNNSLKMKPFQQCEDKYLYNKDNNNCVKCPDTYTFVNNNCIKNSYIVNNYSLLSPSENNINYNSIINNININKDNINNINERLDLCNKENNNNCEIINLNKVSVKCNNDDKRIGDYLCKPNDIKPEIKNVLNVCPENYIKYNLGCIDIN